MFIVLAGGLCVHASASVLPRRARTKSFEVPSVYEVVISSPYVPAVASSLSGHCGTVLSRAVNTRWHVNVDGCVPTLIDRFFSTCIGFGYDFRLWAWYLTLFIEMLPRMHELCVASGCVRGGRPGVDKRALFCKGSKFAMVSGGTGGHVFPAVAVAKALLQLSPTHEVWGN
jgi:hypothetical protein